MKYADFKKSLSGAIQNGSHTWIEVPSDRTAGIKYFNLFTGAMILIHVEKDDEIYAVDAVN